MGLPITLFIAQGRHIVDRAQLPEAQSEALWNRYDFYAKPLEDALRIIQSQSEATAMSKFARAMSGYWGNFVALSLALGMVKLSGDRRIEREKEAKDAAKAKDNAQINDKIVKPLPPAVPAAAAHGEVAEVTDTSGEASGMDAVQKDEEPAAGTADSIGNATRAEDPAATPSNGGRG